MLVLSRKVTEKLQIGEDVTITVTRIAGNRVTLGVIAPKEVRILRTELKPKPVPPSRDEVIRATEAITTD